MRSIVVSSALETQSGYGHHAREFVSQLFKNKQHKWDIKLLSMPWGATPFSVTVPDEWKKKIVPPQLSEKPDVWVQITVPNEFQPYGKYNVGVTAVTEGTICPASWIDSINTFDLIIVPSNFSKQVLEDTAAKYNKTITAKIKVVPEYVDDIYTELDNLPEINSINEIKESSTFLFAGHWLAGQVGEDRKNITGLIYTFLNTFKNLKDTPALILKTSNAKYSITDVMRLESFIEEIKGMIKDARTLPNVYILHGDLTDKEMVSLYNHPKIKAMVSFYKGEGFGRPLLEFTTTGKPLLAPINSGPMDFLNPDFIVNLPGKLTQIHPSAQNQFLLAEALWFTVDYGIAAAKMKEILNPKVYKKALEGAKRQKYKTLKEFNKSAVSLIYEDIFAIIEEDIKDIPMKQPLVLPKMSSFQLPKLEKV